MRALRTYIAKREAERLSQAFDKQGKPRMVLDFQDLTRDLSRAINRHLEAMGFFVAPVGFRRYEIYRLVQ